MKIIRFLSLSLLFLTLLLLSPLAWGEDKTLSWIEMIKKEEALILNAKEDIEKYISEQPDRIQKVREKMGDLNQQLRKLIIIYNIEELNPIELRDKLEQIEYLRNECREILGPLNDEMESLKTFERSIQAHLQEYEQLSEEGLLKEKKAVLREYINELRHVLDLAAAARQLIAILPNSVEGLLVRLDNKKSEIEKDIFKLWKTFFLRPLPVYYFSVEGWNSAYRNMQTWIRFVPYWQIPLKENWGVFRNNLIITLAVGVAMIAVSFFFLGRIQRRFPLVALRRHLFPSFIWLGFGLPLYVMIRTCGLVQFGIYRFPLETLLAGGIVSLAWRMRMLLPTHEAPSKHNILWPLWCVFTASIVSMTNHFPSAMFAPIVALMLIGCALYLFRIRKGFRGEFEKKFGTISLWLLLTLSCISLSKWGNLSTLITAIWFLLLLNIEFGSNIILIMEHLNRTGKERFVANNIVNGIVLPLVLLGSFSGSVAWICMFIGGMPLLNSIIQWRINFGLFALNLSMVIIIVAVFFVVRSITALLYRALDAISRRREEIQMGTIKSIQAILAYIVWCLYILFSLNLLGVKLEHIALIAGGLSIGVGFGLQDMIKNFFSGLILLFSRSIHPGDEIQIEDVRGTVMNINIRNTIVQTNEDSTIFIPNSDLAYKKIANWTYKDPKGRAEIIVGVAYGSHTDRVRTLLIECALAHPQVLREPPPYVLFYDFGESALVFHLRFWIKNLIQQRDKVTSAIRFEIDTIFREHNIEIAFPQHDIRIRSADGLNTFP
ncbi:MAG: mechanosensitive ion channel [Proteobacteria bacterium]|nr:mechanosensitive ion channel [Pseudomonadota bacterium]